MTKALEERRNLFWLTGHSGKAGWPEYQAGHRASIGRRQSDEDAQLAFSALCSPAHRTMLPAFRVGLLSSNSLI